MAEPQAGLSNAQNEQQQQVEQQQQNGAQDADGGEGGEKKPETAARTYTQEELDRILGKVRKNARYLGRKEAEAELRSQGATATQARETVDRQQQETRDEGPPVQKEGESWEEFVERKAEYAGRKGARDEREKLNKEDGERKAAEQRKTAERTFKQRTDSYIKDHPDFAEKVESAENVMISGSMADVIQESEIGPQILNHLIDHPDESERIAGLSPIAAARALGKIEAAIEAETKAAAAAKGEKKDGDDKAEDDDGAAGGERDTNSQAQQTRDADGKFTPAGKRAAPAPIEPGSARSANANSAPSDKDDMNTWMKKRDAEDRKERLARRGR